MRITMRRMQAPEEFQHDSTQDELPRAFPSDLLDTLRPFGERGRQWVVGLLIVGALCGLAYLWQLVRGLRVTGLGDLVFWGVYMANFIFFIGISYAGTLISAVMRLTGAHWRRPITRVAELITVVALLIGASMIVIDMGRPDRLHHVLLYGRLQSPILWDVLSITTYLTGSILYLYVAAVPDLAVLAVHLEGRGERSWRTRFLRRLSLGFRGTPGQVQCMNRGLQAMAIILIPVAISAHSVVAWIFGMTLRPGWHSTIFAPYFVVGAVFSGTAALILAMAVFRRIFRLEAYITVRHFRYLGWILLSLTLLYAYFTFSEYLTGWYGGELTENRLLGLLLGPTGFGLGFWFTVVAGMFLPFVLLVLPGWSMRRMLVAAALIVVAMWVKRYLIVVPTLLTPFLPADAFGAAESYAPTIVEWGITLGGITVFLLLFTLAARLLPIVSIWEMAESDSDAMAGLRRALADNRLPEPAVRRAPIRVSGPLPDAAPVLLFALAIPALLAVRPAQAQARPDTAAPVTIELTREIEGEDEFIMATVLRGEEPLEGVRVEFFVERTFGLMTLGEDVTLDDGTAAVDYPTGLTGGSEGELHVVARLRPADSHGGPEGRATMRGEPVTGSSEPFPRALWAPAGPVWLITTIVMLLAVVWLTYAYVIRQLFLVRQLAWKE